MFTHSFLGTNDVQRSKTFYDAVMGALGHASVPFRDGFAYPSPGGTLAVAPPRDGAPATVANGHTLGFLAGSATQVDAFHAAGVANGGECAGPPGVRPETPSKMYGAYLRDPDGNKICAFAPNDNPGA